MLLHAVLSHGRPVKADSEPKTGSDVPLDTPGAEVGDTNTPAASSGSGITQHIGKHYSIKYNARLSYQWYKTPNKLLPQSLTQRTALSFHHQWHRCLSQQLSSSSTSSFGCIHNFPHPPMTIPTKPSTSTFINSTAHLVPPSLYPPMPCSNNDLLYIPFNPLNPPRRRPSPPYWLGEDISGTGMGMRYIGIVEWNPGILRITIRHDGTSNHYTQQVPQDDIIDPEKRDIRLRCIGSGRAVKLLWQELIQLFKSCTPQWWHWRWMGRRTGMDADEEGDNKKLKKHPIGSQCDVSPLLLIDFSMTHLWLHRHFSWLTHLILGTNDSVRLSPSFLIYLTAPWWVTVFPLLSFCFVCMTHFPVSAYFFSHGCTIVD